jgi:transposase InsO family protein
MCELARVSRASFYRHWEASEPDQAEMALRDAIQKVAAGQRFYGYRRVTAQLRKQGWEVGIKRVRRIMKEDNLLAAGRRKFVVTSDAQHPFRVYPNLAQRLELTDINQLWVADLTYVRLEREFVYLAVVLDAFSRKVIGWALSRSLDHRVAMRALDQALETRRPQSGLVHHSDRGSQYACADYVSRLEKIGAFLSMSRSASPWENGKCESLIKTLKKEEIDARPFSSFEQLQEHLREFIEEVYNSKRLHSALEYCSPVEFERGLAPPTTSLPAALSFVRHQEIYFDVCSEVQAELGKTASPPQHSSK